MIDLIEVSVTPLLAFAEEFGIESFVPELEVTYVRREPQRRMVGLWIFVRCDWLFSLVDIP